MTSYTVSVTDAQKKALEYNMISIQDWIENFVNARAETAIDEIVNTEIQRKLAVGETISGTKEDIVMAADIQSAEERSLSQPDVNNENISPFV
jgi:translation initiation factor 6 (eIF-6)